MHASRYLVLVAVEVLCNLGVAPSARANCNPTAAQLGLQANTADAKTIALQNLEGCFQIPASNAEVVVGIFDRATGNFNFAGQDKRIRVDFTGPATPTGGHVDKPDHDLEWFDYHIIGSNAVNVTLVFKSADNTPLQVSVRLANALPATTCGFAIPDCPWPRSATPANWTATGSPAKVNIGTAIPVVFTVTAGSKSVSGYLRILRPPILDMGVFTLPALPLEIVYGMPQDVNGLSKNTSSISSSSTTGISYSTALSTDSNTTQPLTDGLYTDPTTQANSIAGIAKSVSDQAGDADLKTLFSAFASEVNVMGQLLGSIGYTYTAGASVQQNHMVIVTASRSDQETTGITGGPGLADKFVYIFNIKMMWVAENPSQFVKLVMLAYDRGEKTGLSLLQYKDSAAITDCVTGPDGHTQHCFTPEAARNLLTLDPFTAPLVGIPYTASIAVPFGQISLKAPRFVDCTIFDLTGSAGTWTTGQTHTMTQQDQNSTVEFDQMVRDFKKGFLAQVGASSCDPTANLGDLHCGIPNKTGTLSGKTTTTVSNSTQTGTTIGSSATLNPQGAPFAVQGCFDTVFSSFAFVPLSVGPQVRFHSSVPVADLLPTREVALETGGVRYVTRADAQGGYAFHVPVPQGEATLVFGQIRRPLSINHPVPGN
jgi:hypothetical protein